MMRLALDRDFLCWRILSEGKVNMFNSKETWNVCRRIEHFYSRNLPLSEEMVTLSIFNPRFFWPSQCSPVCRQRKKQPSRAADPRCAALEPAWLFSITAMVFVDLDQRQRAGGVA
jgi:hypothetical protein